MLFLLAIPSHTRHLRHVQNSHFVSLFSEHVQCPALLQFLTHLLALLALVGDHPLDAVSGCLYLVWAELAFGQHGKQGNKEQNKIMKINI